MNQSIPYQIDQTLYVLCKTTIELEIISPFQRIVPDLWTILDFVVIRPSYVANVSIPDWIQVWTLLPIIDDPGMA